MARSQYAPSSTGDAAREGRGARSSVADGVFTPEATPTCRSSAPSSTAVALRTRHVHAHPARRRAVHGPPGAPRPPPPPAPRAGGA
ncbi:MAG: hypothetical protein L0I76_29880, partial [Pseudonocardia sp.]|nr:hypothetical protein [Pseudonocardia sp.]